MKRRLATLLLVLYVTAIVPVSEWAKLPYLWDHYCEHKLADASMDFFDFINHHYGNCLKVYPDAEKDMQLPFKSDQHSSFGFVLDMPKNVQPSITHALVKISHQKTRFVFSHPIPTADETDPWQPPKLLA